MSEKFMVKVRPFKTMVNVLEIPSNTTARSVDSKHYMNTGELRYLGMPHPLETFGSFGIVAVETGFEEVAGETTVVCVDPKNDHLLKRKRTLWQGAEDVFIIHESTIEQ
jgi:hypothetical protein